MSMRTIEAARKRANERLQRNKGLSDARCKKQSEDRADALSTVKTVKFFRG